MAKTLNGLTHELTVNRLLELAPEAVELLDDLGIDSCCGGSLSLREAALDANLDPDALLALVDERYNR